MTAILDNTTRSGPVVHTFSLTRPRNTGARGSDRVLLLRTMLISLTLCSLLSGCSLYEQMLMMEKPSLSGSAASAEAEDDFDARPTIVAPAIPASLSWMDKYGLASSFTPEERQARLVMVNTLIENAGSNEERLNLILEQATLMGVSSEKIPRWQQARKMLRTLETSSLKPEQKRYVEWLENDLQRRQQHINEIARLNNLIEQQKSASEKLEQEVVQLKQQIDALTNIEQNLTEKKATQAD